MSKNAGSATPTAYMDESGTTGENLIDVDQRVFSVAAVVIHEELARSVVDDVRAGLPSTYGEPSFRRLSNSGRGRIRLVEALGRLPSDCALAYVVEKQFMAAAKMVDLLVVERAHEDGYNMYADKSAVALANLLHLCGPIEGNPARYREVLRRFVGMARYNSESTIDEFFTSVNDYLKDVSEAWRSHFDILLYCREQAEELLAIKQIEKFRDALDPAIPCVYWLCVELERRYGPYKLIHDESKVVARHALTLLSAGDLPDLGSLGAKLGTLGAVSIDFGKSELHAPLLIADWVAGAVRQIAASRLAGSQGRFERSLDPVVRPWLLDGIWPDPDVLTGGR